MSTHGDKVTIVSKQLSHCQRHAKLIRSNIKAIKKVHSLSDLVAAKFFFLYTQNLQLRRPKPGGKFTHAHFFGSLHHYFGRIWLVFFRFQFQAFPVVNVNLDERKALSRRGWTSE